MIVLVLPRYGLLIRKGEQKGGEESSSLHMSSTAGLASGLCSFITVIAVIVGLLTLLYFFYYPMGKRCAMVLINWEPLCSLMQTCNIQHVFQINYVMVDEMLAWDHKGEGTSGCGATGGGGGGTSGGGQQGEGASGGGATGGDISGWGNRGRGHQGVWQKGEGTLGVGGHQEVG